MDPYIDLSIGSTIKDLRVYLGISQKQLSNNICTQSLISQIENGNTIPNTILLKQLAEKLGITVDGLLLMSEYPKFDHFKKIETQLIKLIERSNYSKAFRIIEFEKVNISFESEKVKQFFLWAEGVCQYYLNKDFTLAMELLKKALDQSNNLIFSYQDAKILNSQGILYAEENFLEKSIKTFKRILATKEKLSPYLLSISSLLPKVYYNLAKVLTMQGRYGESINFCKEGIRYSENIESISDLGELYFQVGLNYEKTQRYTQSLTWLIKSQNIFSLKVNNYEFLSIITNKIQEVSLLLKKQTNVEEDGDTIERNDRG